MNPQSSIHVAVAGARGKMGRVAVEAFTNSKEFEYSGGFAREADPSEMIHDSIEELLLRGKPDVLMDCTTHPASVDVAMAALTHGVRPVIAASGWSAGDRAALAEMAEQRGLGALLVPNFSLGAILMMRFAEEAARFFPNAEIVELHRIEKKDKPSGTALQTAERITRAGAPSPPIHSVRLPGLLAHQEVLFGGTGELLTIRHDSFSRDSFVAGMYAAVRAVMNLKGLAIGLDSVMAELACST